LPGGKCRSRNCRTQQQPWQDSAEMSAGPAFGGYGEAAIGIVQRLGKVGGRGGGHGLAPSDFQPNIDELY
jgi:hypothetical protein